MEFDMMALQQWIIQNWYLLLIIGVAEIMPFLPTESNGIIQAVVNIVTRVKSGKV
jgi:hypothetical protein